MLKEVKYSGLDDRQTKIKENEALGLRMLHDNFDDPAWKPGDPQIGTLIFTDVMPPAEPIIDWQAEWNKAGTATEKAKMLAKMLGLKVG